MIRSCLTFLLYSVIPFCALGQTDNTVGSFHFTQFTTENGLPQNSISHKIVSDKEGFLWFGTQSGLIRYDGNRFENIEISDPQGKELQYKRILRVSVVDGCAHALIKQNEAGIDVQYVYNTCTQKTQRKISPKPYQQFFKDFYKHENAHYVEPMDIRSLNSWVYQHDSLYYLTPLATDNNFIHQSVSLKFRFTSLPILKVIGNNLYLFGQKRDGSKLTCLKVYLNEEQKIVQQELEIKGHHHLESLSFDALESWLWYRDEQYIYLPSGRFLFRIKEEAGVLTGELVTDELDLLKAKFNIADTKSANTPTNIFWDEKLGDLWFGSNSNGLIKLSKQNFRSLFTDYSFYAQLEVDSNLLLSADYKLFDLSGKQPVKTTAENYLYEGYSNRMPFIRKDDSTVWTTKYHSSVAELNLHTGTLKEIEALEPLFPPTILRTKDRKLWVGGQTKFGYQSEGQYHAISTEHDSVFVEANTLAEDKEGNIVIGGKGAKIFNPHTGTYRDVLPKEIFVRAVYVDKENTIWLGSYGQGFYKHQDGITTPLPLDEQEHLKFVHCFLEDREGYFWISTNQGLFRTRKLPLDEYTDNESGNIFYLTYTQADGISTNEFNGGCTPCGIQLKSGLFSFPTIKGLAQFDPLDVKINLPENEIFLRQIKLNGRDTTLSAGTVLAPQFKNLSFSVTVPFRGNPDYLQLSYRVKGFSKNWTPIQRNQIYQVTTLPHGDYALEFRYRNGFGAKDYTYKTYPFSVDKFFYQEYYFYALVLLAFVLLSWAVYRYRLHSIRRTKRLLEIEVAEKTRSLNELLEALQNQNIRLENENLFKHHLISIITHNINAPIKFIAKVSNLLQEKVETSDTATVRSNLTTIEETSLQLHQLISNILLWVSSRRNQLKPRYEQLEVLQLVREISSMNAGALKDKSIDIDDSQVVHSLNCDPDFLKIILQNLVHNAVKYSQVNQTVSIRTEEKNQQTYIHIRNVGQTIPDEVKDLILHSGSYNSRPGTKGETGYGLGLNIVKELLQKMGGVLEIDNSRLGENTVSISLKT